jgi:hypothetical protein
MSWEKFALFLRKGIAKEGVQQWQGAKWCFEEQMRSMVIKIRHVCNEKNSNTSERIVMKV